MKAQGKCVLYAGAMALALVNVALAGTIDVGGGWRASWPAPPGGLDIQVDEVTPQFVKIRIVKDFTAPPTGGVFEARVIDFVQIKPDAETVPQIIISQETISNLTGAPWTDYHWAVFNQGEVWFKVPESAAFDVTPFANKDFSDPYQIFNDPNRATDLDVDGGLVPPGGVFSPGAVAGDLCIGIDLTASVPVSFTFKQFPTPEPAGLVLVTLGALALRRRG